MNFAITWLFDKLGYMPKIDMQVGKVNFDLQSPDFKMWPFPNETEKRKPAVKKTVAKKTKAATKKTIKTKAK